MMGLARLSMSTVLSVVKVVDSILCFAGQLPRKSWEMAPVSVTI